MPRKSQTAAYSSSELPIADRMHMLTTRRAVYELYACATSYEGLHAHTKANSHLWKIYSESTSTSFKFTVNGYNHSIPQLRVREILAGFAFMDFKGPVNLQSPDVRFAVYEECELRLLKYTSHVS